MKHAMPLLAAALLLAAAGVAAQRTGPAPAAPQAVAPGQFRFERLNRTYQNVETEILPVESGLLTVRLTSPVNALTVRNHLLRLEPGVDGSHAGELEIEISGQGRLVADVALAGFGTRLQDQVTVPAQTQRLEGRLRLARTEGGYAVTPEQLPRRVAVRIRSGIAADVVAFCERIAALPGIAVTCDGLDRALSTAVVPLPAPGETFLLEDADLTPDDRRRLDAYLAATPRPGRAARSSQDPALRASPRP
jgi:hypothetical protein